MPDPPYKETHRIVAGPEAPLPVMNRMKRPAPLHPVTHQVEARHVVRDAFFLLGVTVVGGIISLNVSSFIAFMFGTTGIIALIVIYWLMGVFSYTSVATWGRQPDRVRTFRLLWDMIAVGILLGGYMLSVNAIAALIIAIANLLASAIGLAISFKIAPYVPDVLLNDSREDPDSHEK